MREIVAEICRKRTCAATPPALAATEPPVKRCRTVQLPRDIDAENELSLEEHLMRFVLMFQVGNA